MMACAGLCGHHDVVLSMYASVSSAMHNAIFATFGFDMHVPGPACTQQLQQVCSCDMLCDDMLCDAGEREEEEA